MSLSSPSDAQLSYLSRRLAPRIGDAKLLNVAWVGRGPDDKALLATGVTSLLPQASADPVVATKVAERTTASRFDFSGTNPDFERSCTDGTTQHPRGSPA